MENLVSTEAIISKSEELSLYTKLIQQLNKDFLRANISVQFSENLSPKELKSKLYQSIESIIKTNLSDYLNLLYLIDVSEVKIKQLQLESADNYLHKSVFLLLFREWQKVWFRAHY